MDVTNKDINNVGRVVCINMNSWFQKIMKKDNDDA